MERIADKMSWIKDLVKSEEQMEETGVVDLSSQEDPERFLVEETVEYLQDLKNAFVDASSTFNEMKVSPIGRIKIYGIAKTVADFMLFRNGYRMIFSLREAGKISIKFNFISANYVPSAIPTSQTSNAPLMDEHILEAKVGAFQEVEWSYKGGPIRIDNVVRHHITLFVKSSNK